MKVAASIVFMGVGILFLIQLWPESIRNAHTISPDGNLDFEPTVQLSSQTELNVGNILILPSQQNKTFDITSRIISGSHSDVLVFGNSSCSCLNAKERLQFSKNEAAFQFSFSPNYFGEFFEHMTYIDTANDEKFRIVVHGCFIPALSWKFPIKHGKLRLNMPSDKQELLVRDAVSVIWFSDEKVAFNVDVNSNEIDIEFARSSTEEVYKGFTKSTYDARIIQKQGLPFGESKSVLAAIPSAVFHVQIKGDRHRFHAQMETAADSILLRPERVYLTSQSETASEASVDLTSDIGIEPIVVSSDRFLVTLSGSKNNEKNTTYSYNVSLRDNPSLSLSGINQGTITFRIGEELKVLRVYSD